jgi:predicted metalloenzyme YecM
MHQISQILGSPDEMLATIFDKMAELGLPTDLQCDHICYRVETLERYEDLKIALAAIGTLESEAPINGRPICIFKLNAPYLYNGRAIDCIELPAPKDGSPYQEGWEHAEFIVGVRDNIGTIASLNQFMAKHPNVTFKYPKDQRAVNPECTVVVSEQFRAKFHPQHIMDVIELEKRELDL